MIISNEQFRTAYRKLPFPIREFIASDDLGEITQEVGKAHQLHVDTIGALERETTNMLLGIINPEQFVGELKSVGIPQESVGAIVEELNAKIFIPLREKMRNQPAETDEPEEDENDAAEAPQPVSNSNAASPATDDIDWIRVSPAPQQTAAIAPAPVAAPIVQAPPQVAPNLTYAAEVVPTAAPIAPIAVQPQPLVQPPAYTAPARVEAPSVSQFSDTFSPAAPQAINPEEIPLPRSAQPVIPPANIPTFTPAPPKTQTPPVHEIVHARTMREDMRIAQMAQAAQITQPVQQNPQPTQRPISVIPPAAPVTVPATPTPVTPVVTPAAQQNANRDALHAVLKEYGVDPYREPPE